MPNVAVAVPRPFAFTVHGTVAALAGLVVFMATAGLVDSMPLAGIAGALAAAVAAWRSATHPRLATRLAGVPPTFRMAFGAGVLVVAIQLAALSAFIVDPSLSRWSANAARPWLSAHSCVSAYWVAAEKATTVPDLYVEAVYRPVIDAGTQRQPNLGPFFVDAYEYPPTFLPPVRLLRLVTPDFWGFRRLWFALNLAGVALGLVAIARRLDTALGTHTVWLTPWILAAPAVIGTFQAGNVQLLFIVLSVVALLCFERGRAIVGGILLGYAIVSKLYPGVLVLYLLLRRDWRAVGWTAATGVALTLVSLVDVGWAPMAAFLHHLPQILSGEAFPGLYRPQAIAINESVPGIVFKLGLLGVPGMGFPAARLVGWLYTVVVVVATAWLARRPSDRRLDPLAWIAILILATLRSPFLPLYGVFPALWLATLVMGLACARRTLGWTAAALWVLLAAQLGQAAAPHAVNSLLTFGHTLASLVMVFGLVPGVAGVPHTERPPQPAVPVPA